MTDQLTGRDLDRKLAEAMDYRAEPFTFAGAVYWQFVTARGRNVIPKLGSRSSEVAAWECCPPFSADTDAGWAAMKTVVDWMAKRYLVAIEGPSAADGFWQCDLYRDGEIAGRSRAKSLPEATARAALAALGVKDA